MGGWKTLTVRLPWKIPGEEFRGLAEGPAVELVLDAFFDGGSRVMAMVEV